MPFERPAQESLLRFTGVSASSSTFRRHTEKAGGAYVEVQTVEVERLERETPEPVAGPALQQMSVDGAFVPLVHGQWAEVKTLVLGTVSEPFLEGGERRVRTSDLSYFSRLADHESFGRLATVETWRRGTERAGAVCAVNDGAEWEQKFVDLHRPDAIRILDFAHAAGYVAQAGQAMFGEGTAASKQWLQVQLHELKWGDPDKVLGKLRGLREDLADQAGGEGEGKGEVIQAKIKVVAESLEYLHKRREQIRYAEFIAAGYPIGSGAVESGNKLVVEARLKGAGMHWAREHVDGMVALRNALCSGRWIEAWAQLTERMRQGAKERSAARGVRRRAAKKPSQGQEVVAVVNAQVSLQPASTTKAGVGLEAMPQPHTSSPETQLQPRNSPHKPSANHPWRRGPACRPSWPRTDAES
jgi:hypothetical protein